MRTRNINAQPAFVENRSCDSLPLLHLVYRRFWGRRGWAAANEGVLEAGGWGFSVITLILFHFADVVTVE